MKIEAYCACGGALKGTMNNSDQAKVKKVIDIFRQIHTIEGCKPSDAATAGKTRRRKARQSL